MKKETHQMLKALLLSKDLKTGLLAYDLLSGKTTAEKVILVHEADAEMPKNLLIFWKHVLEGNLSAAIFAANDENKKALSNSQTLQMLQGLLACDDLKTAKLAYEILAGIETIESALLQTDDEFMQNVLKGNFTGAMNAGTPEQNTALAVKSKPNLSFTLNTTENLHRLKYIMLDQKLTIDDVINVMVKSYYEVLRADEHAQLIGEDLPQIYYI